jgi:hypothetical protein
MRSLVVRRVVFYVVLVVVTSGLAGLVARPGLDLRGASAFIRPFHHGIALSAAVLAAVALAGIVRVFGEVVLSRDLMAVVFTAGFLVLWMALTPYADALGVAWEERSQRAVGDTGPGWFYPEDSGMGNRPTPFFGHVLSALVLCPLALVGLLVPGALFAFYPGPREAGRSGLAVG